MVQWEKYGQIDSGPKFQRQNYNNNGRNFGKYFMTLTVGKDFLIFSKHKTACEQLNKNELITYFIKGS